LTVLFAALAAVGGMLIFNDLPRWARPPLGQSRFARVTSDRFFLFVEARDRRFQVERTAAFLAGLKGGTVDRVEEDGGRARLPRPLVLGGVIEWPWEVAHQVLDFYAEFFPNKPDPLCMDLLLRSTPGAAPTVAMSVCWSGELKAGERVLQPLRGLTNKVRDELRAVPYVAVQGMFDGAFPDGRKYFQKSGLVRTLNASSIELMLDIVGTPRSLPLVLQLQGLGGAAGRVKPGDTAFVHREARWDMAIITEWDDPARSEANLQAMRDIWMRLEPLTDGFYVNSRYEDNAQAFHENYGSNYPRLVRLKNRYDPLNLFRLNANVAPAAT